MADSIKSFFVAWVLLAALPASAIRGDDKAELAGKAWTILHERCHSCHGSKVQEADLRLDSREATTATAVVPGSSQKSSIIERLRSDDPERVMPPQGSRLSSEEISLIARWIDADAPWPESVTADPSRDALLHWAWTNNASHLIPVPSNRAPLQNPVDAFVQSKLEKTNRSLSPAADRRDLYRRLSFDLVGLPPSPEEMNSFLADTSEDAFERASDRMLASPAYGERWGRHWMDLVRYADTAGDNADYPVPEAQRYRDYIIDAFNADKPYDAFIVEQLAGDILASDEPNERYAERVIATGFVALSRRYATAPFELMHLTIEDTIETTGRTFLGLTLRCARCHDHKFDPITMEDYYGLYGIFASTRFPYAGSEEFQSKNLPRTGFVPTLPPSQADPSVEAYRKKIAGLDEDVTRRQKEIEACQDKEQKKRMESELAPVRSEFQRQKRLGSPVGLDVAYAVWDDKPIDHPILRHGEPSEPEGVARRRAPRFLAGDDPLNIAGSHSGRLELARWIASPTNPLTSRVMVNRIWQHHFGQGIVRTSSNFGILGQPPTHPELLDWLAQEFVHQDWSMKAFHRLILSSATWQQKGSANGSDDPNLGQYPRRRLDAESIRDGILSVAGNLDRRLPERHPFPDIAEWHWTQHNPFKMVYPTQHRSVYLMRQRIQRHPFLVLFDAPDANVSTEIRTNSIVPQQALFLMNNPFMQEQSSAFANRMIQAAAAEKDRVASGIEMAWCRPATDDEVARGLSYIERFHAAAVQSGLSHEEAERETYASFARVLLTSNEFFYLD